MGPQGQDAATLVWIAKKSARVLGKEFHPNREIQSLFNPESRHALSAEIEVFGSAIVRTFAIVQQV